MQLDQLSKDRIAVVTDVRWSALPPAEAQRLRALGIEEGAEVELLQRGILFWRDPLAVRVNRMTIAMRRSHAAAIACREIAPR